MKRPISAVQVGRRRKHIKCAVMMSKGQMTHAQTAEGVATNKHLPIQNHGPLIQNSNY
jgi:hypothetical protein